MVAGCDMTQGVAALDRIDYALPAARGSVLYLLYVDRREEGVGLVAIDGILEFNVALSNT